jgi:TRAG family protein
LKEIFKVSVSNNRSQNGKKEKTMSSKATQWGDLKDLKLQGNEKFFGFPFDTKNENGVVLGVAKGKKIIDDSKANILLVAPARSGKEVSVEIPSLLSWKESALVYDFKGELYHLTSGKRKNILNNMILKLSPFENNSLGFNPFEEVRFFTEHAEKDLEVIGDALFSEIEEKDLKENILILFKLLALSEMYESNCGEENIKYVNFASLYYSIRNSQEIPEDVFTEENSVLEYLELYENLSIKEKEKAFVEFKKKMKIFTEMNLSKNTSKSDFNISDLYNYKEPVTLYYTGHPNYKENDILFKIIVSQLIHQKTENLPDYNYNYNEEHKLLLMFSDFQKISRIPQFERNVKTLSLSGTKLFLSIEKISDVERVYGNENSILNNMNVNLFFTNSDNKTVSYVDELLISDKKEVLKLSTGKEILKVDGKKPVLVDKFIYFEDKIMGKHFPLIVPESLKDVSRQYLFNTASEKEEMNYIPNVKALRFLKDELDKNYAIIKVSNPENKNFGILIRDFSKKTKEFNNYLKEFKKHRASREADAKDLEIYKEKRFDYFSNNMKDVQWASLEYIEDFENDKEKLYTGTLLGESGVMLGKIEDRFLIDNSRQHILLTMPSRSGKGVSCIVPTILKTWKESLFVFDVKGENYQLTSGARKEKFDNHILRFAPKSKNSCRYNPLAEVRILSEHEVEDIRMIADTICKVGEVRGHDNALYAQFSSNFIFASIFYVLYKNFLKNPKFVYENGRKNPVSNATIAEIIEFIGENDKIGKHVKTNELLEKLKKISKENIIEMFGCNEETKNYVKEKLNDIYKKDIDREIINKGNHPRIAGQFSKNFELPFFGSVLSQTIYNLSIFDIPQVKENMSASDFRMYDLMNMEKPVSLYYVVSPADILELSPITKIFIKQMFDRLTPEIDYTNQTRHKWKMLALMDEFPALGKLEELETGIGYYAGYGIKMLIVLQSIDQLFRIYGEKNRFLPNCTIQVFGRVNDKATANYVSEICGKTEIEMNNDIYSKNLITAKEAENLSDDKLIIKKTGLKPILADKFIYFKSKDFYEFTKIPFVISESLYDNNRKYYKLNEEQKRRIGYIYNYLPSEFAIERIEERIFEMRESIEKYSKNYSEADDIDKERYEEIMRSYSVNSLALENTKKSFNLFKEINKINK